MQSSKLPLIKSGVSPLIHAYLTDDSSLDVLHSGLPTIQNVLALAAKRDFDLANRRALVDELEKQYNGLSLSQKVKDNLISLRAENSRTVATGHQLCLMMGPMYMISKVCSAISLANRLQEEDPSRVYVPVFWLATEDHDFEEINHLHLFNKKVSWPQSEEGAVGRMSTQGIDEVIDQMEEILGEEFSDSDIRKLIRESYRKSNLEDATRHLFNELFGSYGLIILDGDSKALKSLFSPIIANELQHGFSENAIAESSAIIRKAGYKTQINPREINLFYLKDGYRDRIVRNGDDFQSSDGEYNWTRQGLLDLVSDSPELFSPNVALRPVYQESILPNVAYIGGGGEIAYWMQLKKVFEIAGVQFPALVVRESTLFVSKGISKKIKALGLENQQLFESAQEVLKTLLSSELPDWKELEDGIHQAWRKVEYALDAIDPTLSKSASSEKAKSSGSLKALQAKALRAAKEKHEAQVRKVEAVRNWVYPNGTLQERYINVLQLGANEIGSIIQFMISEFEPGEANMHVVSVD